MHTIIFTTSSGAVRRRHVKIFSFCGGFEIRRASNNNVASYFMSTLNIYAFIARDDGNFQ